MVCLRFSCVGVDGTFKFFWGGVTFFIIWVITGKITQAIVDNIYRKIKQKKFDEYLREGCLEMMEPTVGKNKEWILNDFRKIFSGFNKNEYEINNRDISCSFFIGIPEGTLEIKCKPYFNDNGICNDYDVWYIFYDLRRNWSGNYRYVFPKRNMESNKEI